MLDANNPEIRVDEIMQRVQEKVRARRLGQQPRDSGDTPTGVADHGLLATSAVEEVFARAREVANVGAAVPPMSRLRGPTRALAGGFAKAFLRVAQLITRDQRDFNHAALELVRTLADQLGQARSEIIAMRRDSAAFRAELTAVREELSRMRIPTEASDPGFDDQLRGSREEIRQRLSTFLPMLRAAQAATGSGAVLDVGCGRGELLELLREEGVAASGVDSNRSAVDQCHERGLEVVLGDAFEKLREVPDGSLGALTAIHVVEHLPYALLLRLIDESWRVLRPGGLAIFETPNPNNVLVGSCTFYLDPTRRNPVHPRTLQSLFEARGMVRVETMDLHPYPAEVRVPEGDSLLARRFNEYFYGPRDYAVLGYRP